jgi:hypothetical protein
VGNESIEEIDVFTQKAQMRSKGDKPIQRCTYAECKNIEKKRRGEYRHREARLKYNIQHIRYKK